jgi:ubiquinone/menaquinone biosynthesis C-methylase UbiE
MNASVLRRSHKPQEAGMSSKQGFYANRVFPWLNDKLNADPQLEQLRAEALAPARGRVVEIGFGSGLNLPHYPPSVQTIVAVDPSEGMRARAMPRVADSRIPVEFVLGSAEQLPLGDVQFDTAVSVLTLCTVEDPARVLAEVRRVLRDDGRMLLMEHGLADDESVARWQRRLNGLQRVVACGCNLNRRMTDIVRSNGFEFESVRQFFVPKMPRTHGWVTLGTARKVR